MVNKSNIGAGPSRNRGISKSKGYFLAFIDSDDYWHKDKLKKQINFMEKNNLSLTHTSYKIIDKNGKLKGLRKAKKNIMLKIPCVCPKNKFTLEIPNPYFKGIPINT